MGSVNGLGKTTPQRRIRTRAVMAALVLAAVLGVGLMNLGSMLLTMAELNVRLMVSDAIGGAVKEAMWGVTDYSKLIGIVADEGGESIRVQADAAQMADLTAQVSQYVQRNLRALEDTAVEFPLGVAFGHPLLSGIGPKVRVWITPVGSATARFVSAFETAGINQARHQIALEVTAAVRILLPPFVATVNAVSVVPVTESVIAGYVPDTYVRAPVTGPLLGLLRRRSQH